MNMIQSERMNIVQVERTTRPGEEKWKNYQTTTKRSWQGGRVFLLTGVPVSSNGSLLCYIRPYIDTQRALQGQNTDAEATAACTDMYRRVNVSILAGRDALYAGFIAPWQWLLHCVLLGQKRVWRVFSVLCLFVFFSLVQRDGPCGVIAAVCHRPYLPAH